MRSRRSCVSLACPHAVKLPSSAAYAARQMLRACTTPAVTLRCLATSSRALHTSTILLCDLLPFWLSAGQIAYALAPLIASGQMLGPDTPVLLQLYDVPAAEGLLQVIPCTMQVPSVSYICAFVEVMCSAGQLLQLYDVPAAEGLLQVCFL